MDTLQIAHIAAQEELNLVQRVFLAAERQNHRVVIFTAASRGSGCTWLVGRVAKSLVEHAGASVCAVDANLHWPSLHTVLGLDNQHGLLQAMVQTQPIRNFLRPVKNTTFFVLTSGGSVADSHKVLLSDAFKSRVAELAEEFDYVLIDTPAINASNDATLVARQSDGVVLVLEANSTKRDTAQNAKLALEAVHVPILGAVLNKRTYPIPESIYRRL
jgi:capsular exopolysaccharide synthesis family protein